MDKELREKIPVISFLMMIEVVLYHCESPSNEFAVSALDLKLNTAIDNFVTGVPCILCMSWFFAPSVSQSQLPKLGKQNTNPHPYPARPLSSVADHLYCQIHSSG